MFLKSWITVWAIVSFILLINGGVFGSSGYYSDNGIDQTVQKLSMQRENVQHVKNIILNMVGLPERPHPEKLQHYNRLNSRNHHKLVPKFLWKIYEHLDEDEESTLLQLRQKSDENDEITDEHARIIEKSDTIMTFSNNRKAFPNPKNENRLSFDLAEVSLNGVQLLMSELHFYKRQLPQKHLASNPCVITVYEQISLDGAKKMNAIQTIKTTVGFDGWIRTNFTSTLSQWLINNETNNILYITIEYENELGYMEATSISVNYLLCYSDSESDHQPFITAYFENVESEEHVLRHQPAKNLQEDTSTETIHRRSKRGIRSNKPRKQRRQQRIQPTSRRLNQLTHSGLINDNKASKGCSRQVLYTTFKQIHWDDWILAPVGFGAYYCDGKCDFPFQHNIEATNHAIIQELVHLLQDHRIPKPCCAPSKYQSISLLYMQNETSASIKKYKNMIVTKCTCQ